MAPCSRNRLKLSYWPLPIEPGTTGPVWDCPNCFLKKRTTDTVPKQTMTLFPVLTLLPFGCYLVSHSEGLYRYTTRTTGIWRWCSREKVSALCHLCLPRGNLTASLGITTGKKQALGGASILEPGSYFVAVTVAPSRKFLPPLAQVLPSSVCELPATVGASQSPGN